MTASKWRPEACTASAQARCVGWSSLSISNSFMPSTPFIGVRISWLMTARNWLLARLAARASLLACCSRTIRLVTEPTATLTISHHVSSASTRLPAAAGAASCTALRASTCSSKVATWAPESMTKARSVNAERAPQVPTAASSAPRSFSKRRAATRPR